MANYVNFNTAKPRKSKKYIIVILCVTAFLLLCVYVIGIIANMNGKSGREAASAVSENVQLKQEISEKDAEIERLNGEIAALRGELDARPTPAPAESSPEPSPVPTATDNADNGYAPPRSDM